MEARDLAKKLLTKELSPKVEETEESGKFCHDAFKKLGEAGLAAPMLPEPWGQGDLLLQTIVAEEMGYFSSGFGLSALASVCLFGGNVGRLGTDEQKQRFLPGIASGDKIGCWALTEPSIGSDAVSIRTKYERHGDHYVINGSKTFITNAPIADYFLIIAREQTADGKLLDGFQGASAFIIERGAPGTEGLRTGQPFHKHGHLSSPTGEVFLENVRVPESQLLGRPRQAFAGMKLSLDVERAVFSGLGVGLMQFCLDTAIKYAATRKQFGVPILEHELIQDKIARIASSLELIRTYQYHVLSLLSRGQDANKEAAILKLMGAKMAFEAANDAVQCLGGYGYMREYQLERCLRDARLYEIGGGTSEIQKLIIAKQCAKALTNAERAA